jgi:hypothetical protein
MQDVNVVVVFCSGSESMERLALAAAVGAVQGRANIRLRRLPGAIESMEYVAPRDSDAEWADAIMVGTDSLPEEFENFLGKLKGKLGASIMEGAGTAAMERAGLSTVEIVSDPDPVTAARLQGRKVAETARSLRNNPRSKV